MPRWEYAAMKYVRKGPIDIDKRLYGSDVYIINFSNCRKEEASNTSMYKVLGRMGNEGWELVTDHDKELIFKRQIK